MKIQTILASLAIGAGASNQLPCLVVGDSVTSISSNLIDATKLVCSSSRLEIRDVTDQTLHLFEFGQPVYSNLLFVVTDGNNFKFLNPDDSFLQPESVKFRPLPEDVQAAKLQEIKRPGLPGIALSEIISFVDFGGNMVVLVQGGSGASNDFQTMLSRFGMTIYNDAVVKNFGSPLVSSGSIKGEPWIELITGPNQVKIENVSTVGLDMANKNVLPILRASSTAYHDTAANQGSALTLAAANQAINGARFTLVGTTQIDEIAVNLLSWSFGKRGVLRIRDLYHHRVGEEEPPRMYKEKDVIEVGVKIEELQNERWVPFPATEVQLEYVMLDPHIRETMKFTGTEHKLVVTAPDVYGIFKFRIDYKRRGYNPIKVEQVAPVRNMKHNDYDRFLFCAYPYYTSCFATLALVLLFSFFFVNHKEVGKKIIEKEARHRE
jgi:oligosaccharyltransferase complex subunit beta